MKTNEYMEQTEQYVLHTYNRFPLVIDHGEGVHLYDTDGKAYLDFAAGIAVYALGYSNDDYQKSSERPGGQSHPCFQPVLQCSDGLRGRKAGEGIRHG